MKLVNPIMTAIAALLLTQAFVCGDDFTGYLADRTEIERVYHLHRTGNKASFEEAMPPVLLERLVRADLHKEAVLRKVYGVGITPEMLAAEVERINATTRAPEILAEIKAALGGETGRFARGMARPILVERELRSRFENDDRLHADQRRAANQARVHLLAGKPVADLQEGTWQLMPRPAADAPAAASGPSAPEAAKSASYSVEATAQVAQALAPPDPVAPDKERRYLEDLDPQLQNVLRAQLRKPGDVSAVVEMPAGFLVFQARGLTVTALTAASISIPRRSYEEWLAQQPASQP